MSVENNGARNNPANGGAGPVPTANGDGTMTMPTSPWTKSLDILTSLSPLLQFSTALAISGKSTAATAVPALGLAMWFVAFVLYSWLIKYDGDPTMYRVLYWIVAVFAVGVNILSALAANGGTTGVASAS